MLLFIRLYLKRDRCHTRKTKTWRVCALYHHKSVFTLSRSYAALLKLVTRASHCSHALFPCKRHQEAKGSKAINGRDTERSSWTQRPLLRGNSVQNMPQTRGASREATPCLVFLSLQMERCTFPSAKGFPQRACLTLRTRVVVPQPVRRTSAASMPSQLVPLMRPTTSRSPSASSALAAMLYTSSPPIPSYSLCSRWASAWVRAEVLYLFSALPLLLPSVRLSLSRLRLHLPSLSLLLFCCGYLSCCFLCCCSRWSDPSGRNWRLATGVRTSHGNVRSDCYPWRAKRLGETHSNLTA